ncbi:acylphosphatase [Actinomycetota bacterium]
MRTIHAVVTGTVQGVGFRYRTQRKARQLGLTGWVRNQTDGSVEVLAQGPNDAVTHLASFLEEGPPGATVTAIEVTERVTDPDLDRFEITF